VEGEHAKKDVALDPTLELMVDRPLRERRFHLAEGVFSVGEERVEAPIILRREIIAAAEYERAKILERSRRGRRHAARSGLVNAFTTAPYGYRYIPKDLGGGTACFEVVPEEVRVVRQIFAGVSLERLSLREVCRRLQHAGCVPRRARGAGTPQRFAACCRT
jgi:hypothetical protein